ncbi:2-succinyl-5-enolpyruvyl-6-hydroxy-3-cyclohexene-1-carboxylic-acid synthase [Rhodocyclus tenuis]|uniref:2-succinyl-5-enolpyruvyl-6-hydroxy-3- cyclohexene-1-carboxylic-acid synthase n=1 Tax=Rhodocyclus tenuis TaxID=1066 RepID=UPI001905E387|nr:2-succinyl-5-enolpyruvyl-6-hydroxy-3-cyclohexene-1-carboxylic-acid synthase [Rhodocyclus tenuis]MBK1679111.1 2-succinyl-5-enolpyruvyl-6-hydroxy-3-cyclohexene-1-carboxylic-acid synthase [Rhodocyclus tenuis]
MSLSTTPTADQGLVNLRFAQTLVDALAAAGVSDAVISPGSRSTPLALAFLRQPAIRSTIAVDERCAAFFALGRAKASGRPVALLCTSGSAPANWYPAVIEAAQGGTPLLLLSADRPAELHGWGANQTIDQLRLFGSHVRASHALEAPQAGFASGWLQRLAARVVAESLAPQPGPVHLNLPFREPLLPAADPREWPQATELPLPSPAAAFSEAFSADTYAPGWTCLPDPAAIAATAATLSGRRGVIVCGGGAFPPAFAEALLALAAALDCPLFAEPLSGLRFAALERSQLCVRQESFLRDSSFVARARPDWVMRCGDFPVTRQLQQWLSGCATAEQIVIAPPGRWNDPQHVATRVLHGDALHIIAALTQAVNAPAAAAWRQSFVRAEAAAEALAAKLAAPDSAAALTDEADRLPGSDADFWEGVLIPALLARLPAGFRVFCGASMAIRDLDSFSGGGSKPLAFFANRGASGIDGNLSTAAGIAAAGPTLALVGDLTCTHDIGGLALARGRPLLVVVINNGGGGIFEYLPAAALPEFARGWLTPADADFAHMAATWGIGYQRAATRSAFAAALELGLAAIERGDPCLIEAVIDREHSVARHRAWWEQHQ